MMLRVSSTMLGDSYAAVLPTRQRDERSAEGRALTARRWWPYIRGFGVRAMGRHASAALSDARDSTRQAERALDAAK